MRARRVDANHSEIKAAFRDLGCSVLDLSRVGEGCPDLLVAKVLTALVEVKTEKGKHTPAQIEFNETWRGAKATVRDLDDVVKLANYLKC